MCLNLGSYDGQILILKIILLGMTESITVIRCIYLQPHIFIVLFLLLIFSGYQMPEFINASIFKI